jgi:hypothetical protein
MRLVSIGFVKFMTVCSWLVVQVNSLERLAAFYWEPDGQLLV